MKTPSWLFIIACIAMLTACGGSGSDSPATEPTPQIGSDEGTGNDDNTNPVVEGTIYGPYSTGSASEPATVYFDLDSGEVVDLSEAAAATDTQWDIAFRRTEVMVNTHQDTAVSVYFTGNNADFYDNAGEPIASSFLNATVDSELDDYLAVKAASIPAAEEFITDSESEVIGDTFYNYDMSTHVVTAADDVYYVVASDENYTKFRITDIQTEGRLLGELILGIAHQSSLDGASEFADEVSLNLNTVGCSEDIYVDFDTQQIVTAADGWDLSIPCGDGAAEFALTIPDDATVLKTDIATFAGIDAEAAPYYGFSANQVTRYAFDNQQWYYYDTTSHLLYSQFGVYLIKVGETTYKFQITSYYDDEGTSGNYSFRFDPVGE
ncbi:hypothetical protein CA267_007615 [Alteromonas pelagimontana]|uniref:HmuY family protein n=1 Tax=Alteromonas pelagimontana TaxID=1858656 RepID=A0A6M4MCA2_9ALTE|nr:HmuY family protein [Alteromonas pelagimontana]QJR80657.1 hypothetical protein CA267_007615 [Alteromonas pelagimontana]